MTAIAVHTAANAVYVATDAAVYDRGGVVVSFERKAVVVGHWPGAVTGSGNAAAVPLVVEALSGAFATWDDMVSGAETVLHNAIMPGPPRG